MQVILLDKVVNLGSLGEIVKVKDGYARNFLIPQGRARRATEANKAEFEAKRVELEKAAAAKLAEAQSQGEKLAGTTVKVTQKDDKGNIAWEVAKSEGLLDLVALETVIKNGLKEQSETEATVSCGGKFRAAEAGKTFECTATDPEGAKHQVAVTIKDAAGNVSYEVVQPQQ